MAVAAQPGHVAAMLQAVIDKGVTGESVAAVEKLVGLYERMQDRDAERQFASAFVGLQSEMPKVQATRPVPNNDGTIRYRYAPFEDVMNQVQPALQKYGFTVSFSSRFEEGRVIQTCTLQHAGGHKRTNEFAARIGKGPPGSSESQGDGAASTYAKRFALCDALNIVIGHIDNDAQAEGGLVTKEQAEELERRLKMVNGNVAKFLAFANAPSFAKIRSNMYPICDEFLAKKENPRT